MIDDEPFFFNFIVTFAINLTIKVQLHTVCTHIPTPDYSLVKLDAQFMQRR